MKEVLKIEIEAICVVHIIAIILSLIFFMIFYMKANKDYALKAFLVVQISMIGWMVFKIFKTVSPTEVSRWWFIVGYYFCACVFEVAFLEFTYGYYTGKPIRNKIRLILYILPSMQFACILTNPSHHLFYAKYNFWGDSFGVLFYAHTAIEYGFILAGLVYGCLTFKRQFKGEKLWYKLLIASTLILPLVLNFLFINKALHKFIFSLGIPVIFDITPIVFVFSTLVFVYATFNHVFINLSPIMRHEIVHKLDTSICVLDSSFDTIYINEKLEDILGRDALKMMRESIKKLDILEIKNQKKDVEIDNHLFTISILKVSTLKETQYLISLNNITDYKKIENKILFEHDELIKTNQELKYTIAKLRKESRTGARNYVARELHDIIGHSLVVAIKLLEVAKLYCTNDKNLSVWALSNSISSIESGIESMTAITKKENTHTGNDLQKDIEKMLNRIKATDINSRFIIKGVYYNLEERTYNILRRICQELVTNSLKHSQANEILVSVNIKKDHITMLVMDNGAGSNTLIVGNGLNGIKERLKTIDGKVEFITSSGEGFMSKININR